MCANYISPSMDLNKPQELGFIASLLPYWISGFRPPWWTLLFSFLSEITLKCFS